MQCKKLLTPLLVLLLAGASSALLAQDAPPPPPDAGAPQQAGPGGPGHAHGPGPGFGGPPPEAHGGVIGDLRELEHLYVDAGRAKDLPALYNEVLTKSQNPRVRDYVYHQLARAQSRPSNLDQAIGTLRKSLDENLADDAKREAEHARMQARFEQFQADRDKSPSKN